MTMHKPLVIEFTGTPNAGKTTLIKFLADLLESMGYKVEIKQEDAEIVPSCIPKKTWERNLWITQGQIQSLLETKFSSADIILFDRGFYDSLFWAEFLSVQDVCTKEDSKTLIDFLESLNNKFSFKPDFLFIIDVSISVSIKRERVASPEKKYHVFSNDVFLSLYKKELEKFCSKINTPMFRLDTSNLSLIQMQEIVLNKIIEIISKQ